jgi:hypothetical protein
MQHYLPSVLRGACDPALAPPPPQQLAHKWMQQVLHVCCGMHGKWHSERSGDGVSTMVCQGHACQLHCGQLSASSTWIAANATVAQPGSLPVGQQVRLMGILKGCVAGWLSSMLLHNLS